jgi:hypothetical protein
MGRLKEETESKGLRGMKVGTVHTRGRMDEGMVTCALEELANLDEKPKEVVIGLPVNCLVVHGNDSDRWFGPERKTLIEKNLVTGGSELSAEYHMTELRKITMAECRETVDRVAKLVTTTQEMFPWAEQVYVTMFPRMLFRDAVTTWRRVMSWRQTSLGEMWTGTSQTCWRSRWGW